MDEQTLADIEKQGEFQFIEECHRMLKEGKYNPSPIHKYHFLLISNGCFFFLSDPFPDSISCKSPALPDDLARF